MFLIFCGKFRYGCLERTSADCHADGKYRKNQLVEAQLFCTDQISQPDFLEESQKAGNNTGGTQIQGAGDNRRKFSRHRQLRCSYTEYHMGKEKWIFLIFCVYSCTMEQSEVLDLNEKVIVGLSGGVDSSVTAYLLKEQGYDVTGVNVHMFANPEADHSAEDARKVAEYLGIPYITRDLSDVFEQSVIRYFIDSYQKGQTPNPCVMCNHTVKWRGLLESCRHMGAVRLATGHYAGIGRQPNGRLAVERAVSAAKDQSYVLYRLTQKQLADTLMPLGA